MLIWEKWSYSLTILDCFKLSEHPRKFSLDTRQILWYNGRRRGLDLSFRTTTTSARMRTGKISYDHYFGALAQHKREWESFAFGKKAKKKAQKMVADRQPNFESNETKF